MVDAQITACVCHLACRKPRATSRIQGNFEDFLKFCLFLYSVSSEMSIT